MRAIAILLWMSGLAAAAPSVEDVTKSIPACATTRHCFRIQLHITADANGLVTPLPWVVNELEKANALFEAADATFELAGVDTLPESVTHVATRAERNAIAKGHLGRTAIHVFVVTKLDNVDEAGEIRGVTWHNGGATYIIISTIAPKTTLGHELGHFFGLPHSTEAISIMNTTTRDDPPLEERRFSDDELELLRPVVKRRAR